MADARKPASASEWRSDSIQRGSNASVRMTPHAMHNSATIAAIAAITAAVSAVPDGSLLDFGRALLGTVTTVLVGALAAGVVAVVVEAGGVVAAVALAGVVTTGVVVFAAVVPLAACATLAGVSSATALASASARVRERAMTALMLVVRMRQMCCSSECSERVTQHLLGCLHGIDHADPFGFLQRQLLVRVGDCREERFVLTL